MMAAATVFAAPSTPTAWSAVAVAVLMLTLWLISIPLKDVSIVDPVWGPAFVLTALVCALTATGCPGRRWLLFALTAIWGLRLGGYLLRRKRADPAEDRRYAQMRERRGAAFIPYSLIAIFGLQGLLVLIVSLPIQVAATRGGTLDAAIVPGIVVWAIGFAFEAIGDEQLRRFKADTANRGKVMDRGLWRYTRHPNYFGDFCVWWGLWLIALPAGGTWWTLVGPAVMSTLLIRVSGAALLEKDIAERRPEYRDYIARTSGFFPWPPRRGSSR
jgi:steroid 5-alpha reductase family enzyme